MIWTADFGDGKPYRTFITASYNGNPDGVRRLLADGIKLWLNTPQIKRLRAPKITPLKIILPAGANLRSLYYGYYGY